MLRTVVRRGVARGVSRMLEEASAASGRSLAAFVGRSLAVRVGEGRLVWRVTRDGGLAAVHGLVDADCEVALKNGRARVTGDGEMFAALAGVWRECDVAAAVSRGFGERWAPSALAAQVAGRAALENAVREAAVGAAEVAAYGEAVREFRDRVAAVERRVREGWGGR